MTIKYGKVFIVSCGPDLKKVEVLALTGELAFIKAIKKVKPKTLNMFGMYKHKGSPGVWFSTQSVLEENGLLGAGK